MVEDCQFLLQKARYGTSLVVNQGVFEVDSGLEPVRKPQQNADIREEKASSFLLVPSFCRFFTQKPFKLRFKDFV